MQQLDSTIIAGHWIEVKDGDERAFSIFKNHYSYLDYQDKRRKYGYRNRFKMAGPGEKMILITLNCDALFIWRKFIDKSGQQGINCAVFRNESTILSSLLILEAEALAWGRWPGERLYTYVNQRKIRGSNPGYCFLEAGWTRLKEKTVTRKLRILEKWPHTHLFKEEIRCNKNT